MPATAMQTHFATPERADTSELQSEIELVSKSPVVDALLASVSALLAILNEHRQIVALNELLLQTLGVKDAGRVWGLRPGEAIKCVHAHEMPGGCGTSRYCSTCGAAISIVSALATDKPVERKCAATVGSVDDPVEVCFRVGATPFRLDGRRFVLLFLQDITEEERWAAMERSFFHDVNNTLTALLGKVACLNLEGVDSEEKISIGKDVGSIATRLTKEIYEQHTLLGAKLKDYHQIRQTVKIERLLDDLRRFFEHNPVAEGKQLRITDNASDEPLYVDFALILRVLTNMLLNAFEASSKGDEVRLYTERGHGQISFSVWNRQAIPETVALRVFQKHFSTKEGHGRGIGTYAIKFIGEELLRGKVGFTSSERDGTVFKFTLPLTGQDKLRSV